MDHPPASGIPVVWLMQAQGRPGWPRPPRGAAVLRSGTPQPRRRAQRHRRRDDRVAVSRRDRGRVAGVARVASAHRRGTDRVSRVAVHRGGGMLLRKASSAGVAASFVVVAAPSPRYCCSVGEAAGDPAASRQATERWTTRPTSGGITATFGAAARAVATNKAIIDDPFAKPWSAPGRILRPLVEDGYRPAAATTAITGMMNILVIHAVRGPIPCRRREGRHSPGGGPGVRP